MTAWYSFNMLRGFLWSLANKGGHSGYDLAAPCGTPITAPVAGTILTAGPYPWGGQIDLKPDNTDQIPGYNSDNIIITFLHESREDVQAGQHVNAGDQLGLSGQPPPGGKYGSGCHIHFEITNGQVPPYSRNYNPIYPTSSSYPLNPVPFLSWLNGYPQSPSVPVQGDALTGVNPLDALVPVGHFFGAIGNLTPWLSNPLRIAKFLTGIPLVGFGLLIAFWPEAAGTAAGIAATAATGDPLVGAQFGNQVRVATKHAPVFGPLNVGAQLSAKQTIKKTRAQVQAAHGAGVQAGIPQGVQQQQAAQHAKNVQAGKKGAATKAAKKQAAAKTAAPTSTPASAPTSQIVYDHGKRIGVLNRHGKFIPDTPPKGTLIPKATPATPPTGAQHVSLPHGMHTFFTPGGEQEAKAPSAEHLQALRERTRQQLEALRAPATTHHPSPAAQQRRGQREARHAVHRVYNEGAYVRTGRHIQRMMRRAGRKRKGQ